MSSPGPASSEPTPRLVDRMQDQLDDIVAAIGQLVQSESPSNDGDALARCGALLNAIGSRVLDVDAQAIEVDGRRHLQWTFGGQPEILLLGHFDTVWPIGSLIKHPWAADSGILRGPGCFDMKTGVVQALFAARELSPSDRARVMILMTCDEEIGAPTSRNTIERLGRGLRGVLVTEAAGDGGALKTARKGMSSYRVSARGRAAHAGLEPEKGASTTVELALQIPYLAGLSNPDRGTTVTPTLLRSGTTANTVPDEGTLCVDARFREPTEQERVRTELAGLIPRVGGVTLEVTGEHRPPLHRSAAADLYDRACRLALRLGVGPLAEIAVGGVSDGNLTAGVGTPTLDGLGAVGGGAHADDEHVVIDEIPRRTALLTALLADLLATPGDPPCRQRRNPQTGISPQDEVVADQD